MPQYIIPFEWNHAMIRSSANLLRGSRAVGIRRDFSGINHAMIHGWNGLRQNLHRHLTLAFGMYVMTGPRAWLFSPAKIQTRNEAYFWQHLVLQACLHRLLPVLLFLLILCCFNDSYWRDRHGHLQVQRSSSYWWKLVHSRAKCYDGIVIYREVYVQGMTGGY